MHHVALSQTNQLACAEQDKSVAIDWSLAPKIPLGIGEVIVMFYRYVQSRPLTAIDPLGLIDGNGGGEWAGTWGIPDDAGPYEYERDKWVCAVVVAGVCMSVFTKRLCFPKTPIPPVPPVPLPIDPYYEPAFPPPKPPVKENSPGNMGTNPGYGPPTRW